MGEKHDRMITREATLKHPVDATFMGHPKGLFYLAFTEAWERFSFYGMTAVVVLYMVNQLFLPGHVEHIAGFAGFRATLEHAAIAAGGGLLVVLFGRRLSRALDPV